MLNDVSNAIPRQMNHRPRYPSGGVSQIDARINPAVFRSASPDGGTAMKEINPEAFWSKSRVPTPLVQVHQAIMQSRHSYTPEPRSGGDQIKRQADRSILTGTPVLQAFEESILREPSSDGVSAWRCPSQESLHGPQGGHRLAPPPSPVSAVESSHLYVADRHSVGSDELNLRSVDDIDHGVADHRDHPNYPQQVRLDESYSGSEYQPCDSAPSHYQSPIVAAVRATEAAWSFKVPKEAEVKPPPLNWGRAAKMRGRTIRPMPSTEQAAGMNYRPHGLHDIAPTGLLSSLDDELDVIDETLESISVFSDDRSDGEELQHAQYPPRSRLSPVNEEAEYAEEDEEDDRRTLVDEGFFAHGGKIGFNVWRDGH